MLRKKKAAPAEPVTPVAAVPGQAPVVVIVETSGARRRKADEGEEEGHPVVKTLLGMALAKRMVKRRKRPLRDRLAKSLREGTRKARKSVRKARRKLR